jgi:hypothetical protein
MEVSRTPLLSWANSRLNQSTFQGSLVAGLQNLDESVSEQNLDELVIQKNGNRIDRLSQFQSKLT